MIYSFYSTIVSYVFVILSCTTLQFGFVCSHSTIVSYIFFILSCAKLQFRFVCSLFGLFFCYDTKNPRPCSTGTIGGSHRFLSPAASQEPMVALPFRPPSLNRRSACTALYPSGQPDQSILPILPLQANFEPTLQEL